MSCIFTRNQKERFERMNSDKILQRKAFKVLTQRKRRFMNISRMMERFHFAVFTTDQLGLLVGRTA
jgi:hypothetical protein